MKRLWPLLLASGVGFTLLCGLGTWQVQRLAQKQALIATLQNRMAVEPIALAQALNRNDAEYLKVRATGQLDVAHVLYKQTIFRGLAGWEAIGPLKTVDGIEVLVDLGAAPTKGQRAKAISEVTGIRATPGFVQARLWSEAQTQKPLGKPHLWDAKARIGAAGDWCTGHRVEDAFLSGLSLALKVA